MKIHRKMVEFHGGEIDAMPRHHQRSITVNCKRSAAPTLTPSMRIALADLKLDRLLVAYPGGRRYPLAERVDAVPLGELVAGMDAAGIWRRQTH
jgi:hypothetical protein